MEGDLVSPGKSLARRRVGRESNLRRKGYIDGKGWGRKSDPGVEPKTD